MWGIVPMAAWHWGGKIAVPRKIPLGHQAAPRCIYAFHPYGALRVVSVISPLLMGPKWKLLRLKRGNPLNAGTLLCRDTCKNTFKRGPVLANHPRELGPPANLGTLNIWLNLRPDHLTWQSRESLKANQLRRTTKSNSFLQWNPNFLGPLGGNSGWVRMGRVVLGA